MQTRIKVSSSDYMPLLYFSDTAEWIDENCPLSGAHFHKYQTAISANNQINFCVVVSVIARYYGVATGA